MLFTIAELLTNLSVFVCQNLDICEATRNESRKFERKSKHGFHANLEAPNRALRIWTPVCCVIFSFHAILVDWIEYICLKVLAR